MASASAGPIKTEAEPEPEQYGTDLSMATIANAPYASRMYLWGIKRYGGKHLYEALKNMFATLALVATFAAAFVNANLPDSVAAIWELKSASTFIVYGILGAGSQFSWRLHRLL